MCHPEYPDERQTPAPIPSLPPFLFLALESVTKPAFSPKSLHLASWKSLFRAIKKMLCISPRRNFTPRAAKRHMHQLTWLGERGTASPQGKIYSLVQLPGKPAWPKPQAQLPPKGSDGPSLTPPVSSHLFPVTL